MINNQKSSKKYSCPMHPEVVSNEPGKCPKCGGMNLVPMDEIEKEKQRGKHKGGCC